MRTRAKQAEAIMALAGLLALGTPADVVTWDGSGDMNWTQPDSTSWGGATYDSGDTVQFLGAGPGTVTVDAGGVTPAEVIVDAGTSYTFTGGSIGGTGALTKSGAGTLTLSADNAYSGGTVVNGGTLVASSDAKLGEVNGGLTFNGTCTFGNDGTWAIFAERTITVSADANVTFNSGGITIRGPVVGSGTLSVAKPSQGNPNLAMTSTANTFTGAMNLNDKGAGGNALYYFNSLGDGPGAGIIRLGYGGQGASFLWWTGAVAPLVLNHRQFDIGGSPGSFIVNQNANSANTITINTDLLFTGAGSRTLTLDGSNPGDNTIAGKIPDGPTGTVISLSKSGLGTWVLSGENTFTGATTVSNGRLVLAGSSCLPDEGTLSITTAGVVRLEAGVKERIQTLIIGGATKSEGVWGAVGNPRAEFTDAVFDGSGLLYVNRDVPAKKTVIVLR